MGAVVEEATAGGVEAEMLEEDFAVEVFPAVLALVLAGVAVLAADEAGASRLKQHMLLQWFLASIDRHLCG